MGSKSAALKSGLIERRFSQAHIGAPLFIGQYKMETTSLHAFPRRMPTRPVNIMNEELQTAIEEIRKRFDDVAFFIPVKIDDCEVPYMQIRPGKTLRDFHYVELYKNWDKGIEEIASVILEIDKKND
jgi:hypothetical protein